MQLAAIHLNIFQDILTIKFQWHKEHASVWLAQVDRAAPGGELALLCIASALWREQYACDPVNPRFCHHVPFAPLIREAEPYGLVYTRESKLPCELTVLSIGREANRSVVLPGRS